MTSQSRCSVIIPVHNRASLTRQCLRRVLSEAAPVDIDLEVVVVDDASIDVTPKMLEEFRPLVKSIRHERSRGFAASCNAGAASATAGEYLVFLNNDTAPEPGWLDELVHYADAHPRAAVVGVKLLYPNETIQHAGIVITAERLPRHIYAGFPGDHPATNRSRRFRAVTGAAMLVRRAAYDEAGGFDEAFTNGYEDVDLCLRLDELGYETHYCHSSVVYHLEKATRGYGHPSESHDLFVKRWPHLQQDDLQYYLADRLLSVTYRDHYPVDLHVSPLLANVISDESEADRLLAERARQVFELLRENTALRLAAEQDDERRNGGVALPPPQKLALFLSGTPGDAMRYRCEHQAEALGILGATADVAVASEVGLSDVLDRYEVFVLHRVAHGPDLDWFIRHARARGKLVVFDTDDLVFEPSASRDIAAMEDLTEPERALYLEGIGRYRAALKQCDVVTVATAPLADLVGRIHERVFVIPNAVSEEMARLAEAAHEDRQSSEGVTIGYLSGTRTHNRDFLEAADAILAALEEHPEARLLVVGLLTLDERFAAHADRIERRPIQRWQRLPAILSGIDVNVAPLERENLFTESKSSIKYLEAGLVGVPTVASARTDFVRVIRDGENGRLADTSDEWRDALEDLVSSSERRAAIGKAARADVLASHRTASIAPLLHETLRGVAPDVSARPLTVNWVLHAPIAQASGGYRTIFRLASHLSRGGHRVRAYIAPVAHLEGLTDAEIQAFVAENFQLDRVAVHVNRSRDEVPDFLPADISIATFWATAASVANHNRSLFKAYYIQDYEPEFYESGDPGHAGARASYDLPLRHICIGRSLAHRIQSVTGKPAEFIDFALEAPFRLLTPPEERPGPVSVLFFARPSMKRRGYRLGVDALERLKKRAPETEIVFFGSVDEELADVPFAFRNLGVLTMEEMAAAMNRAHVLLTFSFSNISHVPFEGMACGCAVVEVHTPENAMMLDDGENCLLAPPEPDAIAAALERLVTDDELRTRLANRGTTDMGGREWDRTGSQFETILRNACFARISSRAMSEALVEGLAPH